MSENSDQVRQPLVVILLALLFFAGTLFVWGWMLTAAFHISWLQAAVVVVSLWFTARLASA